MSTALTEFVQLMVGAITDLATGIASGVTAMAKALFLEVDGTTGAVTGLSVFGGIVGIFAKILGESKSRKNGEGFNTNTVLCFSIA